MPTTALDRVRLESWKQIAAYLDKSERTVRRWHETESLPVHRHQHQQRGSVWAYPDELQEWLAQRTIGPEAPETPASKNHRQRWWLVATGSIAATILLVLLWRSPSDIKVEQTPLTTLPGAEYGPSMSADGKRVAFHWRRPGGNPAGIYIKEVDRDAVTPLAVSPGRFPYLYSPAWSPDGKIIALLERTLTGETWLCTIPSSGGERRRLKQIANSPTLYFGNYHHVSWSRDGRWLIVPMSMDAQQGIYRVAADSGSTVAITQGGSLYAPALSPDGRRLVALQHEGRPVTSWKILLLELNPDGHVASGPLVIHRGHQGSSGIAWMADNRHLALCKHEPGLLGSLQGRLVRMPAAADARMIDMGGEGCSTVALSPDGSLLYAVRSNVRSLMLRAGLHTPGPAQDFLPSSRYDGFPSFSPDGKQVAFYSTRSGKGEMWVARSDGTALRRVASGTPAQTAATWSPNSDEIAYVSGDSLIICNVAGGTPRKIELDGSFPQNPVWSVDGSTIYYTARAHLWKIRADGSQPEMLREVPPFLDVHASSDGQYLYYLTPRQPFAIYRIPLAGGSEEIVKDGVLLPSFAIGAKDMYYAGEGMTLHAQRLSDGREKKLGPVLIEQASGRSLWETRFTVSPDGATVIWVHSAPEELDLTMQRFGLPQ
jgi:Tol biopolymer transport system component